MKPRILPWASLLLVLIPAGAHTATFEVQLVGLSFEPQTLDIQVGDTVRWRNTGGIHDVVADDGSFRSGNPSSALFTFERTFNSAGEVGYHCTVHGAPRIGMFGTIRVNAEMPPPDPDPEPAVQINEGVAGTWFSTQAVGQGFLVEVHPDTGLLVVGWFTWTDEVGEHDWMSGQASYQGDRAEITWFRTRGGRFNAPDPVQTTAAGTGVLQFTACDRATLAFELTDPPRTGSIELTKLLPASPLCAPPE